MSKKIPTCSALMNPLLDALFALGGSGSIDEINEKVVEQENIDEETSSILHNPEKSNQTEIAYRLAWARTYLKQYGFLDNSSRGVWALTNVAREKKRVEPRDVVKKTQGSASSVRDASSDIPVRPAASDPAGPVAVMLQPGGKVPLPRAFAEVLGVSEGDELLLCLEGDELRLYSRATAIEQVQARVRRRLPEGVSLADELIAERRRENRREAAGHG